MLQRPLLSLIQFLLPVVLLLSQTAIAAPPEPLVKAPQVDTPTRLLFVGNSYLYDGDSVQNHVRRMVWGGDPNMEKKLLTSTIKSATIGGSELSHHNIDPLTKPGNIGHKEPFQLVILQSGADEPLSAARRARFREKAIEFNKIIAARGGKTALYLTHAYVSPHEQAKPENIGLTVDLYVSVGNEIGALVIPVSLAFEEAYRRRPGIKLHKEDGTHPELIGTYLAACTVYASVYGKSPVGNKYDYSGKIDRDTATFLQQVAADTVKKFYER